MASAVDLPPIPDRQAFKIGEVSTLVGVKAHVLRFWEQEFPHLTPRKGITGHRFYAREEVERLRQIRSLLYDRGYTIAGARALVAEGQAVIDAALAARPAEAAAAVEVAESRLDALTSAFALEEERRKVAEKSLVRAREEAAFWRGETRRAEEALAALQAALLKEAELIEGLLVSDPESSGEAENTLDTRAGPQ